MEAPDRPSSRPPDPRVQRAIDSWLATISSGNTSAAYRRDLATYAAWLASRDIAARRVTRSDLDAFRRHRTASGDGASTVNRRLAAVATFYRYIGPVWRVANPVDGVQRQDADPKPVAGLTPAEAAAVWREAHRAGGKTAVIVGLILLDGWKTKEVLELDLADLRVSRSSVSARRTSGVAVLDPRTATAIRHHVRDRAGGPLLLGEQPSRESVRLTRFGVDYLVKRAGVGAGLEAPLTVNTLRNAHAAGHGRV